MLDRRALVGLPLTAGLCFLLAYGLGMVPRIGAPPPSAPSTPPASPAAASPAPGSATPPPPTGVARWIVAGGGSSPEYNQVQLEQDLALAVATLGESGPGRLLYAGGPGSRAVQVLDDEPGPEDLRARLASLFDPRDGRDAIYRETVLDPIGASSQPGILETLRGALAETDVGPLTLYLAGHGLGGDEPQHSRFLTWGAGDLWVADLADTLDAAPGHRPVRIVVTSCYGGGFAELAFHRADPEEGEARTPRCGLFATTWDRVASGCDPNPDRGAQEGYGIHFLHALRGETRDGVEAREEIDLDGDAVITLLEAHSWARVRSASLDVPVTTSERFLRAAVNDEHVRASDGPEPHLPEEREVQRRLAEALDAPTERVTRERIAAIDARLRDEGERLDALDESVAAARDDLQGELLHRWPVIDDPWHPAFEGTLASSAAEIEAHLAESATAARLAELSDERGAVADAHDDLLLDLAQLERLARSFETVELARSLAAEGGRFWLRYQSLLACERGRP